MCKLANHILIILGLLGAFVSGCGSGVKDSNKVPVASFVATPMAGNAPIEVSFNAENSFDIDGKIDSYNWKFGDGDTSSDKNTTHIYSNEGEFTATLVIVDNNGANHSFSRTISISPHNSSASVSFNNVQNGSWEPLNSIIEFSSLDKIVDDIYYFPANLEQDNPTVYLPLRRWDIIFTGDIKSNLITPELAALDRFIPGYFNHLLVYIGKDKDGYAYAVELNTRRIEIVNNKIDVVGGIRLIAISKDYGESPHLSGGYIIDRDYYLVRWAKTFTDEARIKLLEKENALIHNLQQHLLNNFPYQLEFNISLSNILFNQRVDLVDDGFEHGAGCADYWTSLFEESAGLCMYNVRMPASEFIDYYTNDPVGREAYLPEQWNPFSDEPLFLYEVLAMGIYLKDDEPHQFSCNENVTESGVVLPNKVYESVLLKQIEQIE